LRLLLVEDDPLLGEGLYTGLSREYYNVDWVKNGEMAVAAADTANYDAVILDIGLPKISGLEVLTTIRSKGNLVPVLILTAQDGLDERVSGLDSGADDYLVKPFEFDELCARIRAITRRNRGLPEQLIRYKEIALDPAAHTVMKNGEPVNLSRREFALLEEFLAAQGRVLSRAHLEDKLYSWGDEIESNAIEVHIHHLRKHFGAELIKTVRGIGYMVPKA
jgi:DNA-binding response OmpR family regulator